MKALLPVFAGKRPAMGKFKKDFYRFFTYGFAAGALLVVATMDTDVGSTMAQNMVPPAQAQVAE